MSILSKEKDGAGFWYGFHESDPRQINVSYEACNNSVHWGKHMFIAHVSDTIVGYFNTKNEAEAAAIAFLTTGRRT